ncbi:MAG: HlyD family efflux transporter periplasmic adaptor subunit [Zoogloeaceae bacterium]|jgi:biotin carboxyl carrier protein|nr:HlyD family efflux transporter periplasmic adaptor subunit [Zoogloeaceae bacterium]
MKRPLLIALCGLVLTFPALPALADDGHGHGDEPAAVSGNGPRRLPDGSVFLPKPAQRQMAVRTQPVTTSELPRAFELGGKVMMDPNAGGKVQAVVAGRVTPGPKGLPYIGQTVKKGEVLAYVTPEAGGHARSLNESRLRRLRELSETVPRKLIEEAEAAVANERLVAPVSGVIAAANVVSGQVVEARETLFEIVDPARVLVEALAFDVEAASDIADAFIVADGQKLPLQLIGAAASLREQALPLLFRGENRALAHLPVGQRVKVFAQSRRAVRGMSVPAAALVKNPANQTIVWVKTAPERFEPRPVTFEPLDGVQVAVTSGLEAGDRVVARAAALLNQIR